MYVEGRAKETAATRHSVPFGQMGGTGGGIAQKKSTCRLEQVVAIEMIT